MDFSQSYIDTGYIELSIPARTPLSAGSRMRGHGGGDKLGHGHDAWAMDPGHLHIWPRHEFMLIALPNQDGSFTSTLFAPFSVFDTLTSREAVLQFFNKQFPDAVPLMGADALVNDVLSRKPSPLATIRCTPYHYKDRALLLGDSAHAMVPFYGQGLNCGFEDVRILLDILDLHDVDASGRGNGHAQKKEPTETDQTGLVTALQTYTDSRHADLLAISELALENYHEMRSKGGHQTVALFHSLTHGQLTLLLCVRPSRRQLSPAGTSCAKRSTAR